MNCLGCFYFKKIYIYDKTKRSKFFPMKIIAAYRRWSNLKVAVIVRIVEACILRCLWLVRLKPKAELTNDKETLPCK